MLSDNTPVKTPNVQALFDLLTQVKQSDLPRFKKQLLHHKRIISQLKPSDTSAVTKLEQQAKHLSRTAKAIEQSINEKQQKLHNVPKISYPDGLPISENAELISQTISDNQVVIIAGETGSGKTTQIPKICLALGRGVDGLIGHTQPRRIAARTVANRIADELNTKLGEQVGYKVRFNDQVTSQSYIKLRTDGILLAKKQKER